MTASVTGASNRTFIATELTPRTSYTFEVAAVSDSGSGPYGMVTMVTAVPNSMYSSIDSISDLNCITMCIQALVFSSMVCSMVTTVL